MNKIYTCHKCGIDNNEATSCFVCGEKDLREKDGNGIIPSRVILVVGLAGEGKSTLCNRCTNTKIYREFNSPDEGSKVTQLAFGTFQGISSVVLDTPGLNDAEGLDAEHIVHMVDTIKKIKFTHAILITFNIHSSRFTASLKNLVRLLFKIFNDREIGQHIAIVFTKYYSALANELNKDKEMKRVSYPKLIAQLYSDVYGTEMVSMPPCCFVDSKATKENDPQTEGEFNTLAAWIQTLKPLYLEKVQVQDPVVAKVETETRTRQEASKQVPNGTQDVQIGTKWETWSSQNPMKGFKKKVEVPVFEKRTIYKTVLVMVEEQREKRIHHDNTPISYGEWVEIRRWEQDA